MTPVVIARSFVLSMCLILWNAPQSLPQSGALDATVKFLAYLPDTNADFQLREPRALAVDASANVFVVDTGNNRVLKFNLNSEILASIGGFGWQPETFDRPLDISLKNMLDVFVADYNNQRIERYDRDLNYIASYAASESEPENLRFGFPSGVDISRHGELFICDNENNRILKLSAFGEPLLSFGDFNWGEGQLRNPSRIDVTANDRVYVSDRDANEIVVYDYYGNYAFRFGKDILKQPAGLLKDTQGLFVADSGNHRVVIFDHKHQFSFAWGSKGEKAGAFHSPMDVAVQDNRIFVLDSGNNRVQVFEIGTPEP